MNTPTSTTSLPSRSSARQFRAASAALVGLGILGFAIYRRRKQS